MGGMGVGGWGGDAGEGREVSTLLPTHIDIPKSVLTNLDCA